MEVSQPGQVDLAVGEDLDGRDGPSSAEPSLEPGDGVALIPVVAHLLAALHELVGDQFDVADGDSVS